MKRLVRFFTNDRLWQMVVALFLAVTLFFTAWSGNTQNKNNSSIASNTFTKTVESVPVDINTIVISTLSVAIPMMLRSI